MAQEVSLKLEKYIFHRGNYKVHYEMLQRVLFFLQNFGDFTQKLLRRQLDLKMISELTLTDFKNKYSLVKLFNGQPKVNILVNKSGETHNIEEVKEVPKSNRPMPALTHVSKRSSVTSSKSKTSSLK
eukprot:CAMPEP_0201281726 /NCGR_PEP_ID=MMETSP1317-20130820/3918_1 /ASSEMBLY_ACC=CAM_ASM_000770 /TAXON_ID=187299 /ORGANISM="Undescribed Undescribed, Strain Undescribed" /LENGTH=126 /DNA_ID=CAMNT_0047592457 /DNA_START=264 /DNA_END=644 /DNA_ORIENTATION=-